MERPQPRPVFFVSDGTGITAETLGNSVLTQFEGTFSKSRRPFIDTVEKAKAVVAEIRFQAQRTAEPVVFLTIMRRDIRSVFDDCPGIVLDLVEASLGALEQRLGQQASRSLGKAHGISDSDIYRNRMAAVEFALEHDDGQSIKALGLADVILVGPSRVGKTPTGMYLAINYGIRAANYPLLDEDLASQQLPDSLRPLSNKLFGLISSPRYLHQIRQERRPNSPYASLEQCTFELGAATKLFESERIPFIDTTTRSIEEISTIILTTLGLNNSPEYDGASP
jgi:[pyruvate, water dikinase]-phosphate phosphotransferase / [pyruvate, water dikinase] kinase